MLLLPFSFVFWHVFESFRGVFDFLLRNLHYALSHRPWQKRYAKHGLVLVQRLRLHESVSQVLKPDLFAMHSSRDIGHATLKTKGDVRPFFASTAEHPDDVAHWCVGHNGFISFRSTFCPEAGF